MSKQYMGREKVCVSLLLRDQLVKAWRGRGKQQRRSVHGSVCVSRFKRGKWMQRQRPERPKHGMAWSWTSLRRGDRCLHSQEHAKDNSSGMSMNI